MASVLWQRTVVRDGWHNMGTDLCIWHDCYWLVYSRNTCHVSPDGGIVVLRSSDLERWQEVGYIKTALDNRDPKILAVGDRLHVYFAESSMRMDRGGRIQTVYTCVSLSDDGCHWSMPKRVYKRNYWLWRVRVHDDTFYAVEKGGELLTSPDGLNWAHRAFIPSTTVEDAFYQEPDNERSLDHRSGPFFNEADINFRPDGELWCVSRTKRDDRHAILYWSSPPYEAWERADLGTMIESPVICESGDAVYVAGRRRTTAPWIPQHSPPGNTGIFRLIRGKVEPVFALPSDGDAAYPGMVPYEAGKLLVSYYSQHAYTLGVIPDTRYVSRLRHDCESEINSTQICGPDDIFVALVDPNSPNTRVRL